MKKLKFLIVIITFVVMATGCGDRHCSNNICFFDYKPTYILDGKRIIDKGEKLNVQVDVSGVEGAKSYKVLTYSEGTGVLNGTNNVPVNTPIPCQVAPGGILNIPTDVKVGQKVFATVVVFNDTACKSSIIAKADTHKVTVTENSQHLAEVDEIFDYIGGESNYCNTDKNGNYNVPPTDNLFVRVAYSQVGYKEKASNKNLNSCTGNSGSGNYQKYGGNGAAWCAEFVAWAIRKSGGTVPFTVQTDAMKTWAKNESRWHSKSDVNNGKYSIHEGDIVKYDGHVGILYKNSSGSWRLIHGNWNNQVDETSTSINSTLEGYISMKGITY